nr:alpha/beta hydrolase-fold protein [Brevibacterium sp. 91QC2O2]
MTVTNNPADASDLPSGIDPNAPVGTVEERTLAPGKYFPGVPHEYAIYRPAPRADGQADGPLPLLIALDGTSIRNKELVPQRLDALIAAGDVPRMAAVFIDPGVLPTLSGKHTDGTYLGRYDRSYEYDSLSPRYANFLAEELLPAVHAEIPLSNDPNDRAIMGSSTGGIACFLAAWHRPDQFRRVIPQVPTFVAMRGGDTLAELVRKTEARPLRVRILAGDGDHLSAAQPWGTFYAGSWPNAAQTMYEALKFSGYDAELDFFEGDHSTVLAGELWPDAMRWLWRDYPAPLESHEPPARGQAGWDTRGSVWETITGIRDWQPVTGLPAGRATGLAQASDGSVYASLDDGVYRVALGSTGAGNAASAEAAEAAGTRVLPEPAAVLAAAGAGRLVTADPARGGLTVWDLGTGPAADSGAEGAAGRTILPDLHVRAACWLGGGDLAVIDEVAADAVRPITSTEAMTPGSAAPGARRAGSVTAVLRVVNLDTGAVRGEVALPQKEASALALGADGSMLIIADAEDRNQWIYQLDEARLPQFGAPFFRLETYDDWGGSASATFDTAEWAYFATPAGVQVCEPIGRVAIFLAGPVVHHGVDAVAFGGADRRDLFIVQDGTVYSRRLTTQGASVDDPSILEPPGL